MNQKVRNALDDIDTAADVVEDGVADEYDAELIRESVELLRDELADTRLSEVEQ